MKRFYTLLLTVLLTAIFSIFFATCKKQEKIDLGKDPRSPDGTIKYNATIVAPDTRNCICCGGYFLSIDNNKPVAGDYFITYDFPENYTPTSFPTKIYIEWEKDSNACINDKIIIKKLIR
jgi:hypothetical protein